MDERTGTADSLRLLSDAASEDWADVAGRDVFVFPTSFAQERLWFLDQLDPGRPVYNIPVALRLEGALDAEALARSLNEIVSRHESLRTTFSAVDGQPLQVVGSSMSVPLPMVDLSGLPAGEREAEARRLAGEEARTPFDLAEGPLLRAGLLRLAEEDHVLLLTMHHIVSDGWSIGVFSRELRALYEAFSTGKPSPLGRPPIQYADFAAWQREWLQGEVLERQLSYWREQLAGAPALMDLPTDRPRPALDTHLGAIQTTKVSGMLTESLRRLSVEEGATLFMTLLAAFQILLYRYTGQQDVLVGTPVANRSSVELEGLIGFFVNTLVLRCDLSGNPTFRELLRQVREVCLAAYEHEDLPFEKLVQELQPQRTTSHAPVFQVMFVYQNAPREALELLGLRVSGFSVGSGTAQFDLTLSVTEAPEGLKAGFRYNTDLFDATTIERMCGHYQTLLEGIVADPDGHISALPVLTRGERYQMLVAWNDTAAAYPEKLCVHQLFEAQVERTPEAVALTFGDRRMTYGDLNSCTNRLAHYLRERGVGPEKLVGICMRHCLEAPMAILGVLKAGGAWVPLDPTEPVARLRYMIEDSGVRLILSRPKWAGLVSSASAGECLSLDLDEMPPELTRQRRSNPLVEGLTPDNLAYVIYTSGTTGRPRGVLVPHRGVVNVVWYRATRLLGKESLKATMLQFPLAFDPSVSQLFVPLTVGGRVRVVGDLFALGGLLSEDRTTYLHMTPSTLEAYMEQTGIPESVQTIAVGGEAVSRGLIERVARQSNVVRMLNFYGPTEATIACTDAVLFEARSEGCDDRDAASIVRQYDPVTIGRPMPNQQGFILDQHLEPVPIGVAGVLHVGGLGLARGYLRQPDLTAVKFIPNPHSSDPGARLYNTGDLARYLPDGRIEFLGRLDSQVKVRGFRVELGAIEAVLAAHPGVRQVVAVAYDCDPGDPSAGVVDRRLVAYIVPWRAASLSVGELRRYLREELPEYMVPSAFVLLDRLPLTPNGKVDRRALPVPGWGRPELDEAYVEPRTPVEGTLAQIWREVLGLEVVGVHDNFFELGGHSLLASRVVSRIRKELRVELPLRRMFEMPTVAQLAVAIEQHGGDVRSMRSPIEPVSREGYRIG